MFGVPQQQCAPGVREVQSFRFRECPREHFTFGGDATSGGDIIIQQVFRDGVLVTTEPFGDFGAALVLAHGLEFLQLGHVLPRVHLRVLRDEIRQRKIASTQSSGI